MAKQERNISTETISIKKNQIEVLEMKNMISQTKSSLDGLNNLSEIKELSVISG